MLNKIIVLLCLLSFSAHSQKKQENVSIVFDTDMGPDYDDVGALTLLHAFADKGEARILATIASTKHEGVGAVLSVLNTYFGRPQIPIAVPRGNAVDLKDSQHWTDTLIARYPHKININSETPDAIELYREILSGEPDNSVTIITVGFLTNIGASSIKTGQTFTPIGTKTSREKSQATCIDGWHISPRKRI